MVIRDVPILDLRGIAAAQFTRIDRIEHVRTVIVDPDNADAFMRLPRADVRSHVIVAPDELLCIGQTEFDDDYLRSLPDGTRYVHLGQPLIDEITPSLFFQKIAAMRVYGQILYSDARSVAALLSRTERLQGQLLEMAPGALRWIGATHVNRDLLTAVAGRPVVSIGPITIDPELQVADIIAGIASLTQIGEIRGREDLVCAVMAKCNARVGPYSASQEQTKPASHPALRVVQV
jgi:hypothetical protein